MNEIDKEEECEACKQLEKTTWIKEPPKCIRHRKKVKIDYYQ